MVCLATPETQVPYAFEWKLNPSIHCKSIFTKKKCRERVNISKVFGFINSKMGITYSSSKRYKNGVGKLYNCELKHIQNYRNQYDRQNDCFATSFHLPKHKWGRIIPHNYLSLSVMHRETRHAFCEDSDYVDLDMKNCAPVILNQICKHHNIYDECLEKYACNHDEVRQNIMKHHCCAEKVAKQLPISLINGGSYKTWITENGITVNTDKKINIMEGIEKFIKDKMLDIVYTHNKRIEADVLKCEPYKWDSEFEIKKGVMSLWLTTIERQIQEECVQYCILKYNAILEDVIPCQDGFMIKEQYYSASLCDEMNKHIKNKFNLDIKWKVKPFDEAIEIPLYLEHMSYDEWKDRLSVKCLADRFVEEYHDYVVKTEQCQINIFYNGRWYDETGRHDKSKFYRYISENIYELLRTETDNAIELKDVEKSFLRELLRNNTSYTQRMDNIIKHVLAKIEKSNIEFDTKPFLLGFNNGVYDLQVSRFRNYNYDDYMTMTTGYDFIEYDLKKKENLKKMELLEKIIDDIHSDEEMKVLYLQILASGLDGRAYQNFFLYNGQGGNGKGLTALFMDSVLGNYYTQPSNGILKDIEKANTASPDMFNLINKRYINFKELEGTIRSAVYKNLTGGGKFVARALYSNIVTFSLSATIVAEFNNAPEFDNMPKEADVRRLIDIYFTSNFTTDPDKIGNTMNGITYKEGNPRYETSAFIHDMRHVFLHLLLKTYDKYKTKDGIAFTIPTCVKNRSKEFVENQNIFFKLMRKHYVASPINELKDTKRDMEQKKHTYSSLWTTILYDEEYTLLPQQRKAKYNRTEFYKYLQNTYGNANATQSNKAKVVHGLIRIIEDEDDEY